MPHKLELNAGKKWATDEPLRKAQVSYMVTNCKLEPKADAQLHVLIGEMMKGAEVMEGKQPGVQKTTGLVAVARAVNAYGEHFSHPGWQAIDLRH